MGIRAFENQCSIVGSEAFWVLRLIKILSMHFKLSVVLLGPSKNIRYENKGSWKSEAFLVRRPFKIWSMCFKIFVEL